ncbi:hypothetical protein C8Q75DRAFT_746835 [Abortiporus biennis]|nr:hypothetical protein C8Q75DRAFT_746835 [Abortiporus biennis]
MNEDVYICFCLETDGFVFVGATLRSAVDMSMTQLKDRQLSGFRVWISLQSFGWREDQTKTLGLCFRSSSVVPSSSFRRAFENSEDLQRRTFGQTIDLMFLISTIWYLVLLVRTAFFHTDNECLYLGAYVSDLCDAPHRLRYISRVLFFGALLLDLFYPVKILISRISSHGVYYLLLPSNSVG